MIWTSENIGQCASTFDENHLGDLPGTLDFVMLRNYSFFEWREDPYMVLFGNKTPSFIETDNYGYQEM